MARDDKDEKTFQLTCIIFHHILVVSVGGGQIHAAAGPQPEKGRKSGLALALQFGHLRHFSLTKHVSLMSQNSEPYKLKKNHQPFLILLLHR